MGLLFGYPEEVSITATFVANEHSQPRNENSAERSSSKLNTSHSLGRSLEELESESPCQKANRGSVKKKGKTRGTKQNLQYLDGNRWVPAVYHHDIREFLISEASQHGEYTYPRERGPGRNDVTSYLESQKNWGPVRDENWADILYDFQKPKNRENPTYYLKNWKFYGKIVISGYDNRPMRRFKDLPDTLSSALHGRDMEAMKRTDPRIRQRDFMTRMPLRHTTPAGTRRPIQSASSIGMRMTRFRQQQGMLSWIGRDGSKTLKNALWQRLPPENKLANSIRGLEPPSIAEQNEIKKGNAGKFLNRAGRRALTTEERARRKKIIERRLRKRQELELGSPEGKFSDGVMAGRRPADNLGVDALAEPDVGGGEQYARHGIPLHDETAGWRPTNNLGVDGLAEPDAEQRGHPARQGGPNNRPRGGISGYISRGERSAKELDTGHLTKQLTEQSEHHAGHRRPDIRSMQCPPTNNTPGPGNSYQPEQDYNQMINPSARGDDTANGLAPIASIYSEDSLGSNLLPLPQDFDIDSFLAELGAIDTTNIPSPPRDCDFESLLSGLPPAGFDNWNASQTNYPSPPEGWNFNYSLPGSQAGSDHGNASQNTYPSPPNNNSTLETPLGKSQQPYYLRPPRRS